MSNKKKLIPALRFPEFKEDGEWEEKKLGELSTRIVEKVGDRKILTVSISAGVGFVSQAEKFSRDISGRQYSNYICLKEGEFAYNKGNSKRFPQGCIYRLEEFSIAATPNVFLCFRFADEYHTGFFKGYFDNNYHGRQLQKFITSGARMDGLLNISPKDFFSIRLPIPLRNNEQQKIADCLSSLDDLLAAHNEKLELLKGHKKGLMQNLFPQEGERVPKFRFPEFENDGEWEEKKLGEVFTSYSGGTPSTTEKNYYGGNIPFIRSAEISKAKTELFLTDLGLNKSSAKLVSKGDLLVALYGANSGDVALCAIDGAINQAILCLKSKYSNAFTYHYLSFKKEWIVARYIQGGQGNLSGDIVKSIAIRFPGKSEQQKIASCLSAVDDLIKAETEKIEALKAHKKGLMQGLFPKMEN